MDTAALKDTLIKISTLFYQEKTQQGLSEFMAIAASIGGVPAFSAYIDPLFDALEAEDYVLAADILYHELAMKL